MSDPSPVLAIANIGGFEMLVVVGLVVLLFGAARIPKLARSLGQASSEFQKGQGEQGDKTAKEGEAPVVKDAAHKETE